MQVRSMHSVDQSGMGKTTTVLFSGSVEQKELEPLRVKLLRTIESAHFLRIDLQNIESLDFSFLALLLSFLKTVKEDKKPYEVVRISPRLVDNLLLLGVPLALFKVDIVESDKEY